MEITSGPDGNLWYTEYYGNNIGRITPAGVITEFAVHTSGSYPWGITSGPDGNIWFTESSGNNIGRITPAGVITEFPIPTTGSEPVDITSGPDGNLWFTEYAGNNIGRITPAGDITEYPVLTPGSGPRGITGGPDGNLWFTEYAAGNVGRIMPGGGVTEYPVPTASSNPAVITAGPDGNLWFTEYNGNKIGKITTAGTPVTEYTIPSNGSDPLGIAAGPDGNLWFAENFWGNIGQTTTSGTMAEVSISPAFSEPVGLATGSDGNLWFTEWNGEKIGQLILAGAGSSHTVTPSAGPGGSISPNTPQTVPYDGTVQFMVTPNPGYLVSSVTGCGGIFSGSVYTTGPVTADCSVTATFAIEVIPYASPGGSISPNTPQIITNSGTTLQYTVTPDAGSTLSSVTGCGGTLSGNTYTTGPITASCSVIATFSMIPVASFSGTPLSGPAPLTVNFTDSSVGYPYPSLWSWTFGDGGASVSQDPVYTYQNAGTYTVSLTVSNSAGSNTATMTNYITVTCPVLPVRIVPPLLYYQLLQSGYDAAVDGTFIELQAATFTETPLFNNGTAVTLDGGYDQCYTTNSGTYSTIQGSLTIATGTVTVRNIVIQ